MKRKKTELNLEYLDRRIDTLTKRFNRFEDTCYNWKRQDNEDIDNLKEKEMLDKFEKRIDECKCYCELCAFGEMHEEGQKLINESEFRDKLKGDKK